MLKTPNTHDLNNATWDINWFRSDDILLVRLAGWFTETPMQVLDDHVRTLLDHAHSEPRIYVVMDQAGLLGISPLAYVSAALHPVFSHPKCAGMIVVGASRQIKALNRALCSSVRFADTLDDAITEIDQGGAQISACKGISVGL